MNAELLSKLDSTPLSQLTADEMESAVKFAWEIIRADYWRDIRSLSAQVREAIKDGEITDSESLQDYVHETVDGTQRVIYTSQNMETLLVSDNADAYADQFGEDGLVKDGSINWAALAYCAIEADLFRQLEAEDVDVNDPCPKPEDEDEDESTEE